MSTHIGIIEELALGSIRRRSVVLSLLDSLVKLPVLSHDEFLILTERHHLWGRGLGVVDIHLLGSALLAEARLWTRDKRLSAAAAELAVPLMS